MPRRYDGPSPLPAAEAHPRFSPDGTRVVYSTFAPDGDGTDARLWTVGADGSGRTALGRGDMPDW